MAKARSGGGATSKNVKEVGYRKAAQRERIRPSGVAQLGQMVGDHITERRRATGYRGINPIGGTGFPSQQGNTLAVETKCGPGGSREVSKTGGQGTHGPVDQGNPMPKAKSLWPGWEK